MSEKEKIANACPPDSKRRGAVGGQAIIEGVMMRSKEHTAIAVRRYDNKKIVVSRKGNSSVSDKFKFLKWPIIRGVVNFIESMILSFSTITEGTDMLGLDEETENPSKFDEWLEKHCGKWMMPIVTAVSVVLGVFLSVALFIFLPTFFGNLVIDLFDIYGDLAGMWRSIIEGILKVIIFIAYIWLTAFIPDMKRVYQYHGAEHKSIFCYEAGLELNVENVKKQSRFHPRCGTSFMFAMIILSIAVGIIFLWAIETVWLRSLLKIALLPITVGIGYEFIRYAGKHDNAVIRALSAPGLWMQNLTTKEPDDEIIEVAITSLKCALPEDFPGFYEECLAANEEEESEKSVEDQENSEENGEPVEENIEA